YVFAPSGSFYHPHPSSVIVAPSAAPGLVASTHPYAPAPIVGQKPFAGPDPKTAGVPTSSMPKAPTPAKNIAWSSAPGSKIAPHRTRAGAPGRGRGAGGMAALKRGSPSYPSKLGPGSKSLGSTRGYNAPAAAAPKYNGGGYNGGYATPSYKGPSYGPQP